MPSWLWLLGGGGILMAIINRKSIVQAAGDVVDLTTQAAGNVQLALGDLPVAAQQYASIVQQVAQEQGVLPGILFGIGWRETLWGTAKALDVQGPSGTGDWTARQGSWLGKDGVQMINSADAMPDGWHYTGTGPWAIPADGKGWGRGLMQIDYLASLSINWADPYTNITAAAQIYKAKAAYINSHVADMTPDELEQAAIAAYNTGEGNVVKSLLAGNSVDSTTAKGNYSADVLSHIAQWGAGSAQA